jgi:hypothetical protein
MIVEKECRVKLELDVEAADKDGAAAKEKKCTKSKRSGGIFKFANTRRRFATISLPISIVGGVSQDSK